MLHKRGSDGDAEAGSLVLNMTLLLFAEECVTMETQGLGVRGSCEREYGWTDDQLVLSLRGRGYGVLTTRSMRKNGPWCSHISTCHASRTG